MVHVPALATGPAARSKTAPCAACTRWSPNGSASGGCADFELTRLPSPIDVHLFRAVGRNVPDDKRLIALSDVRDLTILRDEAGRIRALPQLEHVLDACMDTLRTARAADRNDARLDWNRVLLYVWPVVHVGLDELDEVVRILAPRSEALGLEQVLVQFRHATAPDEEPSEYMLRMSRPPGAGLTVRVTAPPRRADARAGRLHAEGDPGPASRRRLPVRAGPDALAQPRPRRASSARSPSTTWTRTAWRCRSTARLDPTRRASSSAR